jgi:peptidoglycan/LPS O-acetylase OafA/YrhL
VDTDGGAVRLTELDGIRGWAALTVLVCHIRYTGFANYPGTSLFFWIFAQAELSVNVFFILSGDALSLGATKRGAKGLSPLAVIKRIPRLSGAIMISLIMLYIVQIADLMCNPYGDPIPGFDRFWVCQTPLEGVSFFGYIRFAFVDVYRGTKPIDLNWFLWTIAAELKGSIIVFAACLAIPFIRHKTWVIGVYTFYMVKFFDINESIFVLGILLGQLRTDGFFRWFHTNLAARIVMGLFAVLLPILPKYHNELVWLESVDLWFLKFNWEYYCCLVVPVLYASKDAVSFMRNPISVFLGHISFGLYLTHGIVMRTFHTSLVEKCIANGWPFDDQAKNWISICSWSVCIFVAYIFHIIEKRFLVFLDASMKMFLPVAPKTNNI